MGANASAELFLSFLRRHYPYQVLGFSGFAPSSQPERIIQLPPLFGLLLLF